MIDALVDAGFSVKKCCEVLSVSSAGYYLAKTRPMSPTKIRREWLTGLIREVHADSRGTYGSRRVHAELTKGRGVHVSRGLVTILMHNAGIAGIPGPRKVKRVKGTPTSDDLVGAKVREVVAGRVVGERHNGASDARGQGLLLLCARHLQSTHRGLVHRLGSGHHFRGQRA